MTELHPDRLLDGGKAPQHGEAGPLRKAAAATSDRRRSPAGAAARTAPQRRQGETSPTGEPRPGSRPARRPSPRPRPTPHPRSAPAALEVRAVVVDACDEAPTEAPADVVEEVLAAEPVTGVAEAAGLAEAAGARALEAVAAAPLEVPAAEAEVADDDVSPDAEVDDRPDRAPVTVVAGHGRHRERGLRLPRRRPAFYLAAALVGAVGVATFSVGDRVAQADDPGATSTSVSVAQELGIDGGELSAAAEQATLRSDAVLLGAVTASRTAREAEQATAAQVQADADRAAAEAAAEAARPKAVMPIDGARLTSTFGARWGTLHAGIDLAAPMLTPEYAAADGVVLEAGPASGYGNVVYIQHENGDVTVYGHMEEVLVQPGQVVRAGDTIALLGNRGQSTGPHLHFEVHVGGIDGQKVDPIPWLRERGVVV
ncbi:M23 family metallopeptidase [Geodermatophilus sp. FMUSA9-8]|uniref:M23 family metallopeptidase n=1 Tax=Geodermatophilus sp. FMUSA9-8 TaxID=3120155 RepID=UPI00300928C6